MRTQKRRGERAAQREEEAIRRLPLIRYDAIEPVAVVAWRILLFLFLFFLSTALLRLHFFLIPFPSDEIRIVQVFLSYLIFLLLLLLLLSNSTRLTSPFLSL